MGVFRGLSDGTGKKSNGPVDGGETVRQPDTATGYATAGGEGYVISIGSGYCL